MENKQREIKFRAWNNEDYGHTNNPKGMYVGFSFKDIYAGYDEADTTCEDGQTLSEPDWKKLILMQYTGLKDKNGKEIYEGDIIKYKSIWGYETEPDEEIEEVKFVNGAFSPIFFSTRDLHSYDDEIISVTDIEVIGNIYENGELLEKTK